MGCERRYYESRYDVAKSMAHFFNEITNTKLEMRLIIHSNSMLHLQHGFLIVHCFTRVYVDYFPTQNLSLLANAHVHTTAGMDLLFKNDPQHIFHVTALATTRNPSQAVSRISQKLCRQHAVRFEAVFLLAPSFSHELLQVASAVLE